MKVTSTEFQQNIGRCQTVALQSPVAITRNGRAHTVLMSASFFEMVMQERAARQVEDLDDDIIRVIADSTVDPEHAGLDTIVGDSKP